MRKLFKLALVLGLSIVMVACGKNDDNEGDGEIQPQLLLVKMDVSYVQKSNPSNVNVTAAQFTYNDKNKLTRVFSDYSASTGDYSKQEMLFYYDTNGSIAGSFISSVYKEGISSGTRKDSSKVEQLDANGNMARLSFFSHKENMATPNCIMEYKWSNGKLVEITNVTDNSSVTPVSYTNGNICRITRFPVFFIFATGCDSG